MLGCTGVGARCPQALCGAITVIHNAGRGYPRAVNNLCVHALTAAYAAGNPVVDEKAARAALTETATD